MQQNSWQPGTLVKKSLSKAPPQALPSKHAYRVHILMVDTMLVRGIVCAIAEQVLEHVFFRSPDPRQDGSLRSD